MQLYYLSVWRISTLKSVEKLFKYVQIQAPAILLSNTKRV